LKEITETDETKIIRFDFDKTYQFSDSIPDRQRPQVITKPVRKEKKKMKHANQHLFGLMVNKQYNGGEWVESM